MNAPIDNALLAHHARAADIIKTAPADQTEEQLFHIRRLLGIGGSDLGAIAGVNPDRTPLDVWRVKTGKAEPEDLSGHLPVLIGQHAEPMLRELYRQRTGKKVRQVRRHLVHPDYPWMVANLDGKVEGEKRVVEIKTGILTDQWGESGTDEVPASYLLQVTHYMLVSGYRVADLVVLLAGPGGFDVRLYHFELDQELADQVIEIEREFWADRVLAEVEPDPINVDDLVNLYRRDNGEAIEASDEIVDDIAELRELKAAIKDAEKRKIELEFNIKKFTAGNLRISHEGKNLTSWSRYDQTRVDSGRLKEERPEVFVEYSKTTTSNRLNLLKIKKA